MNPMKPFRPGMKIEMLETHEALAAAAPRLDALADVCRARAFSRPAFLLPWARAAAGDGHRPACLMLRDGPDIAAFLPLFARRDRKALMGRRLGPPRFGATPPFEFLIAPGCDAGGVAEAFARTVQGQGWIDQSFSQEPADSRIATLWAAQFERPGFRVNHAAEPGFYMVRDCDGLKTYLSRLDRKRRKEAQRLERRFLEHSEITLHTGADDLGPLHDDMRSVIEQSWKFSPFMAKRGLPCLEQLVESLAPAGHLRLWFARHEGCPIAFLFEIADDSGSRHAYFNAFDARMYHFGPGAVVLFRAVCTALTEGLRDYDFWGYRDYINRLATDLRETCTLSIERTGAVERVQRGVLAAVSAARRRPGLRTDKEAPANPPA